MTDNGRTEIRDDYSKTETHGACGQRELACSATKTALLDMFKDHYWDSLEDSREFIIKHISSVLDICEFEDSK